MVKTTLYIPTSTHSTLRELSERSGIPQAVLIREALDAYLIKTPKPRPTFIGTFGKGPEDGVTSESVKEWARREREKALQE